MTTMLDRGKKAASIMKSFANWYAPLPKPRGKDGWDKEDDAIATGGVCRRDSATVIKLDGRERMNQTRATVCLVMNMVMKNSNGQVVLWILTTGK